MPCENIFEQIRCLGRVTSHLMCRLALLPTLEVDFMVLTSTEHAPAHPIIELDGVGYGYEQTRVLRNVDLSIHEGQLVGLVGPSGAGKTTLLRAILGQLPLLSG